MNTTLNCLIVDDEPPAQRIIEKYIADIPFLALAGKCKNAFEAADVLRQQKIDLLFLDINMPKLSGLDFLRTMLKPPEVIITTAYREYALEGFELNVADYLKKPFSFDRFFSAVNKVTLKLHAQTQTVAVSPLPTDSSDDFIFLKEDKTTYKVFLDDIVFIESIGDYLKVYTNKQHYMVYQTLKKMYSTLPAQHFFRVHKSFIVPLRKIDCIQGNIIKIDQHVIPIGSTYKKEFNEVVSQFKIL